MIFDILLLVIILLQGMFIWNFRPANKTVLDDIETLGKAMEYHRGLLSGHTNRLKMYEDAITRLQDANDDLLLKYTGAMKELKGWKDLFERVSELQIKQSDLELFLEQSEKERVSYATKFNGGLC